MNRFDWKSFLQRWSQGMLASPLGRDLPADVQASGWLGFAPATDEHIAAAERRLGIELPPSYRAFLKVSNGWRRISHAIERVWGTEEIGWFREKEPDWANILTRTSEKPSLSASRPEPPDEEYFDYGHVPEYLFKPEHVKETLQISAVGDAAVYLLNPQVLNAEGEWEAWFLATWLPGAARHRSFLEMMLAHYRQFAGIAWTEPPAPVSGLPTEYIGAVGSPDRKPKPRQERQPPLEDLLLALNDTAHALRLFPGDARLRVKNASAVARRARQYVVEKLGYHRDARAVRPLITLLEHEQDNLLRRPIIDALGKIGDREAVEPLLARLGDASDAGHAMQALRRLDPGRLPEPLLHILRQRGPGFAAAAAMLAELGESRAIPILSDVLKDPNPEASRISDSGGRFLAAYGELGFAALAELLKTNQAHVRRAADGLLATNRPEARDIFERLTDDADSIVRDLASTALETLPPKR